MIFVVWSRSIIYVWYPGSVDFGFLLVLCSICGMIEPCVRFGCIVRVYISGRDQMDDYLQLFYE